jgi:stage III sporulation protein AD
MEIIRVTGLAIASIILLALLRRVKPEIAIVLGVACAVIILMVAVSKLGELIGLVRDLVSGAGVNPGYAALLVRMIAIAFVAEFGADICRDAGEDSVARAVETVGKVMVLVLAVPIVRAVLEVLVGLLAGGI